MLTLPCREKRAQLQCQLQVRGGSQHSRNNNEPISRQRNAIIKGSDGGTCGKWGGFACGAVILSLNPVQTGLLDPIKASNPLASPQVTTPRSRNPCDPCRCIHADIHLLGGVTFLITRGVSKPNVHKCSEQTLTLEHDLLTRRKAGQTVFTLSWDCQLRGTNACHAAHPVLSTTTRNRCLTESQFFLFRQLRRLLLLIIIILHFNSYLTQSALNSLPSAHPVWVT